MTVRKPISVLVAPQAKAPLPSKSMSDSQLVKTSLVLCMCVCVFTHVCVCVFTFTHVCVCVCVCVCVRTFIYIMHKHESLHMMLDKSSHSEKYLKFGSSCLQWTQGSVLSAKGLHALKAAQIHVTATSCGQFSLAA